MCSSDLLGNTWLNSLNLAGYAADIAHWGDALASGGDLLFYAGDLAATAPGRDLVDGLRALTAVDVAASVDPTGSARWGGDWELEYRQGAVETKELFRDQDPATWDAVLCGAFTSCPVGGAITTRHELVILDSSVQNFESLRDMLMGQRDAGREFEIVVLDANRDGLRQIGEILAGRSNLDAIHILSHATDQGMQLGDRWLDVETADADRDLISSWRNALSDDADLLFYGDRKSTRLNSSH